MALWGVGQESEAGSVRFHGHRVTKVGRKSNTGLFRVTGRARTPAGGLGDAEQGVREAHSGAAGRFNRRRTPRPVRCRSLGRGRRATDRGSFRRRVGAGMQAHSLLAEPEMAMRSMTSSRSMSETMRIFREHFGHHSGSASHTFLINSRHQTKISPSRLCDAADLQHGLEAC